jgi:hypothetical protein
VGTDLSIHAERFDLDVAKLGPRRRGKKKNREGGRNGGFQLHGQLLFQPEEIRDVDGDSDALLDGAGGYGLIRGEEYAGFEADGLVEEQARRADKNGSRLPA